MHSGSRVSCMMNDLFKLLMQADSAAASVKLLT